MKMIMMIFCKVYVRLIFCMDYDNGGGDDA